MRPPEEGAPPPPAPPSSGRTVRLRPPTATRAILVAIGVYWAMAWIAGGPSDLAVMIAFGANLGPLVAGGDLWRLVASIFLHWNLLHLGMNAYALYFLGRNLEAFYGAWSFLILFVLAGVGGSVSSAVFSGGISAGASGGVFGLLGASILFAWRFRGFLPKRVTRVMGTALLPWVALNVGLGALIPAIDQAAHLGGLVTGALLAVVVRPAALEEARGFVPQAPRTLLSITLSLLVVSALSAGTNIFRMRGAEGAVLDDRAVAALSAVDLRFALDALEEEVAANPDDPSLRLQRALLSGYAGDWDLAVVEYREVIRLVPDDSRALNNLAWALLEEAPERLRDRREALLLAERAVAAAPDDPYSAGTLATALLRAGRASEAVPLFRRALEPERPAPEQATDRYLLSVALRSLGETAEADEVLAAAVAQDPGNRYRAEAEDSSTQSAPAP